MTPGSMIYGENGQLSIANTVIHDHEKSGWMTFAQMIQKSSNIGAAKVGMALGEWRVFDYLKPEGCSGDPANGESVLSPPSPWGRK